MNEGNVRSGEQRGAKGRARGRKKSIKCRHTQRRRGREREEDGKDSGTRVVYYRRVN